MAMQPKTTLIGAISTVIVFAGNSAAWQISGFSRARDCEKALRPASRCRSHSVVGFYRR